MVSIITITYQRHHILEEAIESYLKQDFNGPSEMIIVNDSEEVEYEFFHPNVRIFNLKTRFDSITTKFKWACDQAIYPYVYRLDDDDLLAPWAISHISNIINAHPNYEIYRSDSHYYFVDNKFNKISSNVNTGNVYSKNYLNRIPWISNFSGEDKDIIFKYNAKIKQFPLPTMLYRWGMSTYHVSGAGIKPNEEVLRTVDNLIIEKENGKILLFPQFKVDYYSQLPK
jgi:glycosyltransferase involved in cell wall biosynthesis